MRPKAVGLSLALILAVVPLWGQGDLVIVNAASFSAVPMLPYVRGPDVPGITPGSLITLFGIDLTSVKGVVVADRFPLPTELAGTSVNFNGVPAPLLAVANVDGREQINLQVPYGLSAGTPDPACVFTRSNEEVCSGEPALWVNAKGIEARHVEIVAYIEARPGIFTVDGRAAVALHPDTGRLVSAADPAKPGEVVAIYATGLGPLKGVVASGVPAPASPPIETLNRPTATVGGLSAEVLFSGLAPGLVGVNQVNVRVPVDATSGDLAVRVGEAVSEPVMLRVGAASPPELLSAIFTFASPGPVSTVTVVVAGKNFSPAATVDLRVSHCCPGVPAMSGLKVVTAEEIRFDLDWMGLFSLGLENIDLLATVVNPGGVRSNEVKLAWR